VSRSAICVLCTCVSQANCRVTILPNGRCFRKTSWCVQWVSANRWSNSSHTRRLDSVLTVYIQHCASLYAAAATATASIPSSSSSSILCSLNHSKRTDDAPARCCHCCCVTAALCCSCCLLVPSRCPQRGCSSTHSSALAIAVAAATTAAATGNDAYVQRRCIKRCER
jgi:hypothetical protein